jgi:peptide/nickel transport system substrate-binding protein
MIVPKSTEDADPLVADRIVSRRAVLGWLASAAGITLLAACGAPATPAAPATSAPAAAPAPTPKPAAPAATAVPPPAPTAIVASAPTPAAGSAAVPKSGGTLIWAIGSDIANLDGHLLTSTNYETVFRAYDRLTALDEQGTPQPQLAESWELSNDGKQLKLNLRKGVQFHTGREFTSDDVKWNIIRVRDPKVASGSFVTQSGWFSTIETPDKYTAIGKFESPKPAVFDFFQLLNMVDPVTMQGPDAATKSVGTGPFSLVEWSQGTRITFAKNKNYWQTGRPYLDGIDTPIVKDPSAMILQLESGAIDVADAPLIREFIRLKADPTYQALTNTRDGQHFILAPNTTVAPFNNKKVRQALRFAIDRKRMNDVALLGVGQPKALPWLPSSLAYDEAKSNANAFDLDRAGALLKDAGVGAFSMDLLPLVIFPEIDLYVQIYQADLAKIGITANILRLDFAQWLDQVNNAKYNGMYASSDGRAQLNPLTYLTASAAANPFKNNEGFTSDALVKLIEHFGAELDPAKQKALLAQINDLYLDESYTNVVASFPTKMLAKTKVKGIEFPLFAAFSVTNAWIDA